MQFCFIFSFFFSFVRNCIFHLLSVLKFIFSARNGTDDDFSVCLWCVHRFIDWWLTDRFLFPDASEDENDCTKVIGTFIWVSIAEQTQKKFSVKSQIYLQNLTNWNSSSIFIKRSALCAIPRTPGNNVWNSHNKYYREKFIDHFATSSSSGTFTICQVIKRRLMLFNACTQEKNFKKSGNIRFLHESAHNCI